MFSEIFIRRLLQPCDSYKKVLLESKEFHINWKKQARAINKVIEFLEKITIRIIYHLCKTKVIIKL